MTEAESSFSAHKAARRSMASDLVTAMAPSYSFRRSTVRHTHIEANSMNAGFIAAFGQLHATTPLSSTPSTQDWLNRAMRRFDLTFGSARDSVILAFFSNADALSSRLQLSDMATSLVADLAIAGFLPPESDTDVAPTSQDQVLLPRQLCDWLGVSYEQLAAITGVSRASFFNWRQPGSNPRPHSFQRVQRLHSIISLLIKRFGIRGARSWLRSGEYPVWDRLMAGDLTATEEAVRQQLFRQQIPDDMHNVIPLDEVKLDLTSGDLNSERAPRRAGRRTTRRRLPSSD